MSPTAEYWTGKPGDAYRQRQPFDALVDVYEAMWRRIYRALDDNHFLRNVLEIGANEGANLAAFRRLTTDCTLTAVEPNVGAAAKLTEHGLADHVMPCPVQHWDPAPGAYDLVFTRGVLIHIPPSQLPDVYDKMHEASSRYIVVAEYYAPKIEPILYRGEMGRLWRGDFAGDLLNRFPDLRLVDYRFVYHRDPIAPQDDVTWFLLEKSNDQVVRPAACGRSEPTPG